MAEQKKHKLLCIVCPKGCEIEVCENNGELTFGKGICKRGEAYAEQELYNPCRVLTTTVNINSKDFKMLPVRTLVPIPKEKLEIAMHQIAKITVDAPVKLGDVICDSLPEVGVQLIASRTIE